MSVSVCGKVQFFALHPAPAGCSGIEESSHYITLHSAFDWLYDDDTTLHFFTVKRINYADGMVKTRII